MFEFPDSNKALYGCPLFLFITKKLLTSQQSEIIMTKHMFKPNFLINSLFILLTFFLFPFVSFADTNVSGYITSSTTWTTANSPYIVVGDLRVNNDVTLTIDPGVTVKFDGNYTFKVQGTLDAEGTSQDPITFTSNQATPATGDWNKLHFYNCDSATILTYATVEYSSSGILIENAAPTITDNTLSNNSSYAVEIKHASYYPDNAPVLQDNTYSSNGYDGILISTTDAYKKFYYSFTLTKDNAPYFVNDYCKFDGYTGSPTVLTINAGVTIKFAGSAGLEFDDGTLDVNGASGNEVTFTSQAATPAAGDWKGIKFKDRPAADASTLDYAIIEYAGASGYPAIDASADIIITNATIRYSQNLGIKIDASSPTITDNTISNSGTYPVHIQHDVSNTINAVLEDNTYSNNTNEGILLNTSDSYDKFYYSTTLTKDGDPYLVNDYLNFNGYTGTPAVLTIDPGVTIKFASGAGIEFNNGTLDVNGSSSDPVTFTSQASSPAAGDWKGLEFGDYTPADDSTIDYAVIEYGGGSSVPAILTYANIALRNSNVRDSDNLGIQVIGSSPTITSNTFNDNGTYAIELKNDSTNPIEATLSNNTYTDNTNEGIYINPENYYKRFYYPVTLTKDNDPYIINDNLKFNGYTGTPADLTIEEGTTLKFASGAGLEFTNATLDAQGTSSNEITFTSQSATPAAGDWRGLKFSNNTAADDSVIDYAIIEYAGANGVGAVYSSAAIDISNMHINYSSTKGIYSDTAALNVSRTTIENSTSKGLYFYVIGGAGTFNNINDNTAGGLEAVSAPDAVDLTFSWWGHESGPSGIGDGSGQSISGNVRYKPWLGAAYDPDFCFYDVSIGPDVFSQDGGSATFTMKTTESVNWTITIKDSTDTTVKTFTGTGLYINQEWLGDDNSETALSDGTYTYSVSATTVATPTSTISIKGGELELDEDALIYEISSPSAYEMVSDTITITGSVGGTNFSSYTLEYGLGETPTSWTEIDSGTSTIGDGTLGSLDTSEIENSNITLRLTATDTSSNEYVLDRTIKVLSIYNVSYNSVISPDDDDNYDSTTINADFTYDSNWTVDIIDASETVQREFTGTAKNASVVFDGKDSSSEVLEDGEYTVKISITEPDTLKTTYSLYTIEIDTEAPFVEVTYPGIYGVSGEIDIIGTIEDSNLDTFEVEYADATSPYTWWDIDDGDETIENDTIATWDMTNETGEFLLRVTATDTMGHETIETKTVDFVSIEIGSVSTSPQFFNPSQSETSTLYYSLESDSYVTIDLYRWNYTLSEGHSKEYVCTLVDNEFQYEGANSYQWDGEDDDDDVLPNGVYTYIIRAEDAQNVVGVFEDQYPLSYMFITPTNLSTSTSTYDPYTKKEVAINYTLPAPGWVDLGGMTAGFEDYFVNHAPRDAGAQTDYWYGSDGANGILTQDIELGIQVWAMPEVISVIEDDTLTLTNVAANQYRILPMYGEKVKISFTLSRQADVTVEIYGPNDVHWVFNDMGVITAGNYDMTWDGTDSNGEIITDEGLYHFKVTAESEDGQTSVNEATNVFLY
jgi:flagellar hook assembly protein FlgD